MRRYFNIFLLYFQVAFAYRSISVVWFLTALSVPLLMLVFWSGATAAQGGTILGWNYATFATYYLFVALAGALFISHIEESIAREDIKGGGLTRFLLLPISYYFLSMLGEVGWRIIQGLMCSFLILMIGLLAPSVIKLTSSPVLLLLAIVMAVLAFLLSFTFKMCAALLAFWFTDVGGPLEIAEITLSLCSGIVIPLIFLPEAVRIILNILPFSYMVYYPILGFLGKLDPFSSFVIIGIQLIWIGIFAVLYKILWTKGQREYTAIGQ